MGLLKDKFLQFLKELSARDMSVFWFQDDHLSKYQWIFTKLGMCIAIVEIWFRIANGQISSIFDGIICLQHMHIFHFRTITYVNLNGFSPNLICALMLWRSGLGLLLGTFHPFLTELSFHDTMAGYYCFMFLFTI